MAIPHSPTTPRNTVAHNSGSQSRIKRAILESTDDVGGRKADAAERAWIRAVASPGPDATL